MGLVAVHPYIPYDLPQTLPMSLVHNHYHVCFRERNDTYGSYALVILTFISQIPTLPPELWRECMRWATLPPSGRLPLDDPSTTLDPWPVGIPSIRFPYLLPEAAYGFEQSCLYRDKRALMLVSKAWAELAVEFMYESLVIERFGVGRVDQVLAALEGSTSFLLKKWVKRVDIWSRDIATRDRICERLARIGLPNLRVQYIFPLHYLLRATPQILLSEQPLQLVEPCGSPVFLHPKSHGEAFGSLRCLTLWIVENPFPTPFPFPSNLRRLTIIIYANWYLLIQNFFSTCNSVALPNLTHLTLHLRRSASDGLFRPMEIINRIGPQLRHLTLTTVSVAQDWTGVDLSTILRVCTQLTELIIPSHVGIREADRNDYRHSVLQTLGIPIPLRDDEQDYRSFSDIFSRREAFPKLTIIRLISVWPTHGEMEANRWLEPYALRLRGHGIRLEDYSGRDILPVPEVENQNELQLSGCTNFVS